jgi:thiamine-monophosphate kinase
VNEFELIERFFTRQVKDPEVLSGVGDDGAIVRPAAGRDLVVVADSMVEGVHFPRQMDAADIAYRAVAVNLSDIAAMAARPRWMTLALTLAEADTDWLEKFADGLFEIGREFDVALIGGDTTVAARR